MTALDVAAAYGLPIHQKGSRHWARCPIHGEKTASLCFFPDGRWYCFGCHQYGDAADLYAALYGVPLGQALRAVRGDCHQPQKPTAAELRRRVQVWKGQRWADACGAKHAGRALMGISEALGGNDAAFWQGAKMAADAEDALLLLESATPAQLLKMTAEALR